MNRVSQKPEGLGGWLVLVALFVLASPFRILANVLEFTDNLGNLGASWEAYPAWTGLVIAEVIFSAAFLAWACINLFLFFKKKVNFPLSWAVFLIANWIFVLSDLIVAEMVAGVVVTPEEYGQVVGQLVGVLIWSSYILRSERVKNTFVQGRDKPPGWIQQAKLVVLGSALFSVGLFVLANLHEPEITTQSLRDEARSITEQIQGRVISEGIRFDRAQVDGMNFSYQYTLTGGAADEWDVNEVVAYMRPTDIETACVDLRGWLEAGVSIQYEYSGNDGVHVATIAVSENDCPIEQQNNSDRTAQFSARDIASSAKEAFVSISGFVGDDRISSGSGFLLRDDGVLATNLHVVQGIESVEVKLSTGEIFNQVLVLGLDEQRDLAILQIAADGLPALRLGDDRALEVGDAVYALGNPLGFDQTFTNGILSARRVVEGVEHLQITAPISEGSSGGPVLNAAGDVIGIATAFVPEGQNLNIAMPSNYLAGMLAVSSTPVPFEELAGTGALAFKEDVRERKKEVDQLLASLPETTRAALNEYEPWEQEVVVRAFRISSLLKDKGWKKVETGIDWAVLADDGIESYELALDRGEYVAFGVCDNDCTDLDLGILEEGGDPLTDEESDAEPVVLFDLSESTTVKIFTAMRSCTTETCAFWVQLYSK